MRDAQLYSGDKQPSTYSSSTVSIPWGVSKAFRKVFFVLFCFALIYLFDFVGFIYKYIFLCIYTFFNYLLLYVRVLIVNVYF